MAAQTRQYRSKTLSERTSHDVSSVQSSRSESKTMKLNLKEHLFAENKIGKPGDLLWGWEMTRTIAALYNSGCGTLRVGVDKNGNPIGISDPQDYSADKSPLAHVLHRYLDPVPPFDPID